MPKYEDLCCPFENCEYRCKFTKNFHEHLIDAHLINPEDAYVKFVLGDVNPLCECGCGARPKWGGWKAGFSRSLRGHNARVDSAFTNKELAKKCVESRKKSYEEGRSRVWNKDLTKSSSEKVKKYSEKTSETLKKKYSSGEITPWQLGLTQNENKSLAQMSKTKRDLYESGKISSWNAGLTKDSSGALSRASKKISESYAVREAGKRLTKEEVEERVSRAGFTLVEDSYRVKKKSVLIVRCGKCEKTQERTLYSIEQTSKCFLCHPKESNGHCEIMSFLDSLGVSYLSNDRTLITPLEIDILIPEHKLAIEFNGLYWHSEDYKGKEYHNNKTVLCKELGVDLIHVFEDEWRDKREIIKSLIKHRLGIFDKKVHARKCSIFTPTPAERKKFLDENHIDGDTAAKFAVGLKYGDEIVAVASLRKPFHKKWSRFLELARLAVKRGFSIPGGVSKLSKHILRLANESGHDGILSYVDTRYGTGRGYELAGFQFAYDAGRTFWWTNFHQRFNRFSYRAFDINGLSEKKVAEAAGVKKIWGCEQRVFLLTRQH